MSDNILVTGAAGFVGQHLVKRLADEGHHVVALDVMQNAPAMYEEHVGDLVRYISGSILHTEFVDTMVFESPNLYDRIFHLAAIVGVDRYIDPDDPLYLVEVNIDGTKNLLRKIRGSQTRFVYTSTSEVFGKNPELPWAEDDDRLFGPLTESRWSYSAAKSVCEHMIQGIGNSDPGVSSTIVRPFNLYGPHQRPQFVIPKFLKAVTKGDVPTVYGDGTQKRCFTYVEDFIDGLVLASERAHDDTETYNLGNTDETEIRELAKLTLEVAGLSERSPDFVDPRTLHGEDYDEPNRRIPDVSRANERLKWEANTSLERGLKETLESMSENCSRES